MQQFKVSFNLRNQSNKDGSWSVQVRIYLNGEREFVATTSVKVLKKDWDLKTERVKPQSGGAQILNSTLDGIQAELIHIYRTLERSPDFSLQRVKQVYLDSINKNKKKKDESSFLSFMARYVDESRDEVGKTRCKATHSRYEFIKRVFTEYLQNEYKWNDITFSQLNYAVVKGFERYLRLHEGYQNHNTLMKRMRFLKTVTIAARRHGLLDHDPFLGYTISFKPSNRAFLTDDEIQAMMEYKFKSRTIEMVRDFFVFSCFTGLAYIDMKGLGPQHIVTLNGKKWIIINRQKTNVQSNIPLLPIAESIIDKYADSRPDKDHLLPIIDNQKMNVYLKEIASICGISKKLTCHVARHTFATLTLSKGVPIESVSNMLGHSSIKMTQIYAKITAKKIEHDMDEFSAKLGCFDTGAEVVRNTYGEYERKKLSDGQKKKCVEELLAKRAAELNAEIKRLQPAEEPSPKKKNFFTSLSKPIAPANPPKRGRRSSAEKLASLLEEVNANGGVDNPFHIDPETFSETEDGNLSKLVSSIIDPDDPGKYGRKAEKLISRISDLEKKANRLASMQTQPEPQPAPKKNAAPSAPASKKRSQSSAEDLAARIAELEEKINRMVSMQAQQEPQTAPQAASQPVPEKKKRNFFTSLSKPIDEAPKKRGRPRKNQG